MKTCTLTHKMMGGLLALLLMTGFSITGYAQMKIGNNPTQIHPASILELESPNQALRLTQGDTAEVNTVIGANASFITAAEGMIMYQKTDSAVYIRLHGWWHRVLSNDGNLLKFWSITGNTTSTDSNFLGVINDDVELHIGTDSTARIIITPSGLVKVVDSLSSLHFVTDTAFVNDTLAVAGQLMANSDSVNVKNTLIIGDSAIIRTLREVTGDTMVLTLGPNGVIHKMDIDSLLSQGIRSINGTNIHLKFGTNASTVRGPWVDSITAKADSTLILQLPNASGADNSGIRGLVDTTTQSFAGSKSFRDSVAIGKNTSSNSTFQVNGNVSMATKVISNGTEYDMTTNGNDTIRTVIIDVNAGSITSTFTVKLPSAVDGRIYTIKKVGDADDNQLERDVIITPTGTTFGDGGSSYTIYNNFTSVTVQAQGGEWYIVGH